MRATEQLINAYLSTFLTVDYFDRGPKLVIVPIPNTAELMNTTNEYLADPMSTTLTTVLSYGFLINMWDMSYINTLTSFQSHTI